MAKSDSLNREDRRDECRPRSDEFIDPGHHEFNIKQDYRLADRGHTAGGFLRCLGTALSDNRHALPFSMPAGAFERLEGLVYHFDKFLSEEETSVAMDVEGYEQLARVLKMAYDQSANGKGRERHGQGLPFHEQAINSIPRLLRSGAIGATTYQTIKKTQEAIGMFERGDHAAAKAEILGSIIYAVATILTIEAAEKTEN